MSSVIVMILITIIIIVSIIVIVIITYSYKYMISYMRSSALPGRVRTLSNAQRGNGIGEKGS